MLYWRFHFEKEIPVNRLFTQWKWTYISDLGPWQWSALNLGYMDKRPSRIQGSCQGQGRARLDRLGPGPARVGLFRCCSCPPPWHVQRLSGVFRETPWIIISYHLYCSNSLYIFLSSYYLCFVFRRQYDNFTPFVCHFNEKMTPR